MNLFEKMVQDGIPVILAERIGSHQAENPPVLLVRGSTQQATDLQHQLAKPRSEGELVAGFPVAPLDVGDHLTVLVEDGVIRPGVFGQLDELTDNHLGVVRVGDLLGVRESARGHILQRQALDFSDIGNGRLHDVGIRIPIGQYHQYSLGERCSPFWALYILYHISLYI